MINKIDLQNFIFEKKASRADLLEYNYCYTQDTFKVSVYRNHSFELIDKTITPYLDFSGIKIDFEYSDYDDSLTFFDLDYNSDLIVLWLDLSRYNNDNCKEFIIERLNVLKEHFTKNILFVPFEGDLDINDSQIVTYKVAKWESELGSSYIDTRLERFSGTKMSMMTCGKVSQDLGLNYFPALLQTSLKCVVVDLDNTLYKGVLGEDGIDGVILSDGHKCLQEKLKQLSLDGVFLCIASKNDKRDVLELFEKRDDFPLKISDFSCIEAHWDSKSDSIKNIEKTLNIHSSSFLFIDDNIGELVSVIEGNPDIKFIHAKDNALITFNVLSNYPGLLKLNTTQEDAIRKLDTDANEKRKKMMRSVSKDEYIKSLEMGLVYSINDESQIDRISELSNKTNQFIFSYKRYSKRDVQDFISSDDSMVISVMLKDKLSDSGIIGVCFLKKEHDNYAALEECFVSCRALGRGIDDDIVLGAIKLGLNKLRVKDLIVNSIEGERNQPAIKFISNKLYQYTKNAAPFEFNSNDDIIKIDVKGN